MLMRMATPRPGQCDAITLVARLSLPDAASQENQTAAASASQVRQEFFNIWKRLFEHLVAQLTHKAFQGLSNVEGGWHASELSCF
jgi:hypothetical protein